MKTNFESVHLHFVAAEDMINSGAFIGFFCVVLFHASLILTSSPQNSFISFSYEFFTSCFLFDSQTLTKTLELNASTNGQNNCKNAKTKTNPYCVKNTSCHETKYIGVSLIITIVSYMNLYYVNGTKNFCPRNHTLNHG